MILYLFFCNQRSSFFFQVFYSFPYFQIHTRPILFCCLHSAESSVLPVVMCQQIKQSKSNHLLHLCELDYSYGNNETPKRDSSTQAEEHVLPRLRVGVTIYLCLPEAVQMLFDSTHWKEHPHILLYMVVYSLFFNQMYTLEMALAMNASQVSLGTISGAQKLLTIEHRLRSYSRNSQKVPMLMMRINLMFTRGLRTP